MIGAERPRLVSTQWFRPGSPRLVLVTRQSVSQSATAGLCDSYAFAMPYLACAGMRSEACRLACET